MNRFIIYSHIYNSFKIFACWVLDLFSERHHGCLRLADHHWPTMFFFMSTSPCPSGAHSPFILCQACTRASHVILGFFETFCLKINFKILMLVICILVFWQISLVFAILSNTCPLTSCAASSQIVPWTIQGSANCEDSDCKYFQFCGWQGLWCNYSVLQL